jgi:hypothetical protein
MAFDEMEFPLAVSVLSRAGKLDYIRFPLNKILLSSLCSKRW